MKPGTYVSRAVFAKLQAENNRLRRDIKIMVLSTGVDGARVRMRWREEFRKEEQIQELLKVAIEHYYKDHPEEKKFIDNLIAGHKKIK